MSGVAIGTGIAIGIATILIVPAAAATSGGPSPGVAILLGIPVPMLLLRMPIRQRCSLPGLLLLLLFVVALEVTLGIRLCVAWWPSLLRHDVLLYSNVYI